MDKIYHEKQEGLCCAQHCLNNLLQGPYFEVTDLAAIAHELDAREHAALGQISSELSCLNNDETGFFSIQVIIQALRNMGLELVPLLRKCPEAQAALEDPTQQVGFVCHYMQHWFAIRKLGNQWFDLNSMFSRPKLISETYLSLYLAQLRQEGNSIYFVAGRLPECEADLYLQVHPLPQEYMNLGHSRLSPSNFSEDVQLKTAIYASIHETDATDPSLQYVVQQSNDGTTEDDDLARAIALSLETASAAASSPAYGSSGRTADPPPETSLENNTPRQPTEPDPEELRRKRLDYFGRQ